MSHAGTHRPRARTSRRGFLAAAIGGAAALPVICAGASYASAGPGPRELPLVTYPEHPAADYGPGSDVEPLNASVDCGLPGRPAAQGGVR